MGHTLRNPNSILTLIKRVQGVCFFFQFHFGQDETVIVIQCVFMYKYQPVLYVCMRAPVTCKDTE